MQAALGALLLGGTGCSRKPRADVVVWSWDIAAKALQGLVPGFISDHPGVTVEVIDLGNQQVFDRGIAGCAIGGIDLPDVYSVQNSFAELFWSRFAACFTDLAPLGADPLRASFPEFKWTELTVGPRIFALPWDSGPVVMFYRRDLYAQAGIDPARIATWDDFLAAGRRMLDATGGKVRMATLSTGQNEEWLRMLANQNGGGYFDDAGTHVTLAAQPCVDALEMVKRLVDAGVVAEGGWNEQLQLIHGSTVAGALYGAWYEGTIRATVADQAGKWGVYRMPAAREGGRRAANLGGSALAVPASSRNPQAAWRFVRHALANTASSVDMLEKQGLVPSYLPSLNAPFVQQPQSFWGGQRIWRDILDTLPDIRPARGTAFFQEARQIVTVVQADYLAGHYRTAREALEHGARQISEASGLPLATEAAP